MIGLSLRIHMLFVLLTALAILALPVSQDQVQAAAGVHHLLPQLAGVDPAPSPVKDVPGHVSTPRYREMAP